MYNLHIHEPWSTKGRMKYTTPDFTKLYHNSNTVNRIAKDSVYTKLYTQKIPTNTQRSPIQQNKLKRAQYYSLRSKEPGLHSKEPYELSEELSYTHSKENCTNSKSRPHVTPTDSSTLFYGLRRRDHDVVDHVKWDIAVLTWG